MRGSGRVLEAACQFADIHCSLGSLGLKEHAGKEYMDNYIKFYLFLNHMIPLNYFIFSTNVEIKMSLY